MSNVDEWVSDKLYETLGYSESNIVQYIKNVGKDHLNDYDGLLLKLYESDFPKSGKTKKFAYKLINKLAPRYGGSKSEKKKSETIAKKRVEETNKFLAKNDAYAMVSMSENESDKEEKKKKKKKDKKEKKRKRSEKERSKDENNEGDSKEETSRKKKKRNLRKKKEDVLDEDEKVVIRSKYQEHLEKEAQQEQEEHEQQLKKQKEDQNSKGSIEEDNEEWDEEKREKDKKERDELDMRLKEKALKQQKNVAEKKKDSSKGDRESKKRLDIANKLESSKDDEEDSEEENNNPEEVLSKLREYARSNYLKRRMEKKIEELKEEVRDEEEMFRNENLTKKEIQQLNFKREIIKLAEEKKKGLKVETYQMPDSYYDLEKKKAFQDKRFSVLTKRYTEEDESKEKKSNQNEKHEWEKGQINKSVMKFGAKGRKKDEKVYELVLEDEIEFIADKIQKGEQELPDELKEESIEEMKKKQEMAKMTESEKIKAIKESLPVFKYKEAFLKTMKEYQVVILVGETGSGKTTQIPQFLCEAGYTKPGEKMVACTQPRRVAAMSVATRVAYETEGKVGNKVGYSVRFEDCTSDKTEIKYMTDGMMLREFLSEPDLNKYSAIIIDEAHERSLHSDILFGLVKDIARFRKDIKLIISSATLQAQKFSDYFDGAPVFFVPGRRFPVDIFYTKAPEANYVDASVVTTLQIHLTQPSGDILIFLTGQEEIENTEELLRERIKSLGSDIKELIIVPIYASLPSEMQTKIFQETPKNARKVVLATNIAETSLTIEGIKYVIDTGFCKQNSYNPRSGMESLVVTPISKANADQRAGRAGRTAAGKCFRLYTQWSFNNELEEMPIPEVQRTNLGNVVLLLKSLGINDLIHFDFMDPPPVETLIAALEQLYALGALNDVGELTKMGRRMAEFPLDPMLSKMLIASEKYNCTEQIATICSMLSVNGAIFFRPKEKAVHADNARKNFFNEKGDHLTLMNVYEEWVENNYSTAWCYQNYIQVKSLKRARDIRDQLVGLLERVEIPLSRTDDTENTLKAITSGFFYHAAYFQKNGTYKTYHKPQTVHIHPSSSLFEKEARFVVYHELVFTSKEFMRQIVDIEPQWLSEIAPHLYNKEDIATSVAKMPKAKGKSIAED